MIFFVANDGTIIKSLPSPVYQGAANSNTIYLVAPFASNMTVTVRFQLPNGVWTTPALMRNGMPTKDAMTAQGALASADGAIIDKETGRTYAVWSYALPSDITRYYGTVTVQFFFYAAQAGVVTATSATSFTVGRGVPAILPDTPTEDVYEQILSNLASIQEQLDNGAYAARSIYAWNNTYTYGANELVFYPNRGEHGVFLKSLAADNTTEPYTDGVLNSESWEEVVDFNVLNELYTIKTDVEQNAKDAAQSANEANEAQRSAEQSAVAAEENMNASIAAAGEAKNAAEIAESFAKYGIKINTDYTSVDELPEVGNPQYIYLIPNGSTGTNSYDEWIWSDSKQGYEKIGTTEIDLSDYATKAELDEKVDKSGVDGTLNFNLEYQSASDVPLPSIRFVNNGKTRRFADLQYIPEDDLLAFSGNFTAEGGLYDAEGGRVYSENNPPPTDGNYPDMTVGHATSAENAANDGNGNNISETYLTKAQILNILLPIGRHWVQYEGEATPAAMFGFTWQIDTNYTGRVLVGSGTGYSLGATGGESTHTLTVDEMPSHNHNVSVYENGQQALTINAGIARPGALGVFASTYTGGGLAHNNMQPYKVVAVWKRTA